MRASEGYIKASDGLGNPVDERGQTQIPSARINKSLVPGATSWRWNLSSASPTRKGEPSSGPNIPKPKRLRRERRSALLVGLPVVHYRQCLRLHRPPSEMLLAPRETLSSTGVHCGRVIRAVGAVPNEANQCPRQNVGATPRKGGSAMTYEFVDVKHTGHITVVTLNRPRRHERPAQARPFRIA